MPLPVTDKVPGVTAEFDASQASGGVSAGEFVAVILAQMTTGTETALNYAQTFSFEDASLKWGAGSMMAEMAREFFKNNGQTPPRYFSFQRGQQMIVRDCLLVGFAQYL